mmetsp:Transcript_44143/g.136259  ORF Transcript_44143/g.136259 Transcript_44143/m.136259 type:complete len:249 (-) Transcript_44143:194-940(-)
MVRHLRVMFLGAPGVGKGTYAQRLVKQVGIPYVASGDLLRAEAAKPTPRGQEIKKLIEAGAFVPDATVEAMVLDAVRAAAANASSPAATKSEQQQQPATGYLLDGFPRNLAQAQSLDSKGLELDWVVNLRQPYEVIVEKLSCRRICPQCGFNYNAANINTAGIVMSPLLPKVANECDHCSFEGEFVARADDSADTVRARLEKYERETRPLEDYYGSQGKLVHFDVLGGASKYLPKLMQTLEDLPDRRV